MHSHFLAIPLPTAVQSRLASFCYGLPQVHWVEQENFHLTLRYFGPLADLAITQIDEYLQNLFFHPFALTLHGISHTHFKGNRGAFCIGVIESAPLSSLKKEVDRLLRDLRLPQEDRSSHPHITLGYYEHLNPQRLGDYLTAHAAYQSDPIEVTSCMLMRSLQTPKRTIYEIVGEYFASEQATGED